MICEKPLTATLEDAIALTELAGKSGRFVGVTYTYSGYPLVQEARAMVARGDLGDIRVVQVEYPLEWMATGIELEGNQQAAWRTDPERNGRGGSIGDIGTHAYHLAGYVTGLEAEAIAADLATFVPGRALDDNAHVMIRYVGGARGLLWSSQVAIGRSNGLRLRVFGSKGGIVWSQEHPNELVFTPLFGAPTTIKRGREGSHGRDAGSGPHSAGPPGGLHRGVREPLRGVRRGHPGASRGPCTRSGGRWRAHGPGRAERRRLHRSGGRLPRSKRFRMGQAALHLTIITAGRKEIQMRRFGRLIATRWENCTYGDRSLRNWAVKR